MKEIKDIIEAYYAATNLGKQTALATVVHLQGSAYRRPGARMLVTEDGALTGAISGGCLEGDALRKAQLVMVQKKPMLVTYDTTDDDDTTLGVGLGCNGIISILIEPIDALEDNNPINLLQRYLNKRQSACIVTLFSLDKKAMQPGTCLLATGAIIIKGSSLGERLNQTLTSDAQLVLAQSTSMVKEYETGGQTLTAFLELLEPTVCLLLFGAGNDCIPLVKMANILGWQTTVIDGRANYANRQRFAFASEVIVSKPTEIKGRFSIDERTAAVLLTHNYNYDISILGQLLPTNIKYIGVLGPKKKLNRMLDELKDLGVMPDESGLAKIYGPAGLDVGAEAAEEIALSILAEIKAVMSDRNGSYLRDKNAPIHHESLLVVEPVKSA